MSIASTLLRQWSIADRKRGRKRVRFTILRSRAFNVSRFLRFLALACLVISATVSADEEPAAGKLLVATEEVRGPYFKETVVLLLRYDETGAMGLVVNRPVDAAPKEALPKLAGIKEYSGTLYWGGPVWLRTLHALMRTNTPPKDAEHIFDRVHLVPMDDTLLESASNEANLRFFVGYTGWAPGQLERELTFDSWHVLPATEELVFAKDPSGIWKILVPPRHYRAAAGSKGLQGTGVKQVLNQEPGIGTFGHLARIKKPGLKSPGFDETATYD